MSQWYYARDGVQQGPVPAEQFIEWVKAGNIGPSDMVWREGKAQWVALAQEPELAGYMPGQQQAGGYAAAGAYAAPGAYAGQPQYGQPAAAGQGVLAYGTQPGAYTGTGQRMPYANFGWRLLAYLIDYIIMYIVGFVIGLVFGAVMDSGMATSGKNPFQFDAGMLAASGVNLLVAWLYYAGMNSSAKQGTLGKMAVGLVVTDMNGNRISFGRATGRYFATILSAIICLIGYIMQAFNDKGQALHDMIAGTLVFKAK